ncbi:hypothetical protein [Hymenobacter latericus]|uniref:hypothetical protein n=1 Tax=Hymenobacter sp. YIM 151858-1 TaxID=2987688 RepID=UPI002226861A|nr:hypothetical protein [Hymenobacter sp. YIM 151858-1]UYZ59665.1 hypothetical protein OIS50_02440 [Hymenobacter sp. YIM 151858-1]
MSYEVANLSLAEATQLEPVLHYAICIDADNRPGNHVGDWPEEGKVYPVRLVTSKLEGMELVHVLGFQAEAPYYNAFAPHRFAVVAEVFLN